MTDKLQNEEIELDIKTIDDMGEMNEDELNAVAGGGWGIGRECACVLLGGEGKNDSCR